MRLEAYALQKKKVKIRADVHKIQQQPWLKKTIVEALESEPVDLSLEVLFSAVGSRIRVDAQMECSYNTCCSRCGVVVVHRISSKVSLEYLPDLQTGKIKTFKDLERINYELEIEEADLDIGWYPKSGLEVADVISEIIALEKPLQIHCTEDNVERLEEGTCHFESAQIEAKDNNPFANLFKLDK